MEKERDETAAAHKEKGKTDVQQTKQEVQLKNQLVLASPPPSSTSSPSHEFSFTISLQYPSNNNNKTKSPHLPPPPSPPPPPPPFATTIDLSPADEIFFHGHLLPLHLLSHPMISSSPSRSSTNSFDSFTFTLKDELLHNYDLHDHDHNNINSDDDHLHQEIHSHHHVIKVRGKSRSFSHLFPKWIKYHSSHHDHDHDHHHDHHERDEYHDHHDDHHKHKIWKSKLDIVKRYMRMVKPFIIIPFRHKRSHHHHHHELIIGPQRESFNSHSGSLRVMSKKKDHHLVMRGGRSEFLSAPVSIRTSPTNSGLLVASGNLTPPTNYKNDSTVEELQAAIQAAIVHCKKSNIAEEGEKDQAYKTTI